MGSPRQRPEALPCAAGTLRRASRSLARLYDAYLGRAGLTTTQFSIMRTLQRRRGRVPLSRLATDLVFERTSLYRALAPLRRRRLIAIRDAVGARTRRDGAGRPDQADRRAKDVVLTPKGERRTLAAMPHWVAAQRAVLDRFGADAWGTLAAELQCLTALARVADAP